MCVCVHLIRGEKRKKEEKRRNKEKRVTQHGPRFFLSFFFSFFYDRTITNNNKRRRKRVESSNEILWQIETETDYHKLLPASYYTLPFSMFLIMCVSTSFSFLLFQHNSRPPTNRPDRPNVNKWGRKQDHKT